MEQRRRTKFGRKEWLTLSITLNKVMICIFFSDQVNLCTYMWLYLKCAFMMKTILSSYKTANAVNNLVKINTQNVLSLFLWRLGRKLQSLIENTKSFTSYSYPTHLFPTSLHKENPDKKSQHVTVFHTIYVILPSCYHLILRCK